MLIMTAVQPSTSNNSPRTPATPPSSPQTTSPSPSSPRSHPVPPPPTPSQPLPIHQTLTPKVYPTRNPTGTSEALITAGSLALGREPVADKGVPPGLDYSGWGFLMPWGPALAGKQPALPPGGFPRAHDGWQVGRISQEHGILTWHGAAEDEAPLAVGDRVRVWPNHSCIAGAGFDYYLVVDGGDEVVDVWVRWRGW